MRVTYAVRETTVISDIPSKAKSAAFENNKKMAAESRPADFLNSNFNYFIKRFIPLALMGYESRANIIFGLEE